MEKLREIERERWIKFHEFAYKDDIKLAEKIMNEHPRWSIISGYYAMHDMTKMYLGKIHNIKIVGENVHKQAIDGLKRVIDDEEEKRKIISLLKKAEEEIKKIETEDIPYFLIVGRKERRKAQYYSEKSRENIDYTNRAKWFIDSIVKVFIRIMEKMVG